MRQSWGPNCSSVPDKGLKKQAGEYLLKVYSQLVLIIKRSPLLKQELWQQVKSWLQKGAKLLTSMVQVSEMLISLLLLLMLALVLFVVGLALLLSLTVLMHIPTKLYQALTKSKTNS